MFEKSFIVSLGKKIKQLSVSCRTSQNLGYANMLVILKKFRACGRAYGILPQMYLATETFLEKYGRQTPL